MGKLIHLNMSHKTMHLDRIKLLLVGLLLTTNSVCQTIVNTYDLITPIDSCWSATTEIQGTFAAGNGVFTALNSGVGIGRAMNEATELWVLSGYNFASESSNAIYATGFINARIHHRVAPGVHLQGFYQSQFNTALEIKNRILYGINMAKKIKTKEFLYNLSSGVFKEDEMYSDESTQRLYRGNVSSSVTTELSDIDVHLTIYYQPSFQDLNDFRMLGELSLQFPISDHLEFEVESALRFDSEPHLNLLPLDFSTVIGMVYSLSN